MTTPEVAGGVSRGCNHDEDHLTLREVRQMRELSLRDVERETGISRATLSKIERGIELPRVDVMLWLSDVYGVSPHAWFAVHEYRCSREALSTTTQGG